MHMYIYIYIYLCIYIHIYIHLHIYIIIEVCILMYFYNICTGLTLRFRVPQQASQITGLQEKEDSEVCTYVERCIRLDL
jgi:hypothetical protein